MARKKPSYVYKVRVFSRHSQRERDVGVRAHNQKEAKKKAEHEIGNVLSIKRLKYPAGKIVVEL